MRWQRGVVTRIPRKRCGGLCNVGWNVKVFFPTGPLNVMIFARHPENEAWESSHHCSKACYYLKQRELFITGLVTGWQGNFQQ